MGDQTNKTTSCSLHQQSRANLESLTTTGCLQVTGGGGQDRRAVGPHASFHLDSVPLALLTRHRIVNETFHIDGPPRGHPGHPKVPSGQRVRALSACFCSTRATKEGVDCAGPHKLKIGKTPPATAIPASRHEGQISGSPAIAKVEGPGCTARRDPPDTDVVTGGTSGAGDTGSRAKS